MSTCEQCYHGSATGLRGVGTVCLYILHEKRRRPCPGGDACTEFVTPEDYAREATTDALGTVMRFDTPEETFAAQTLENAAAMWQALALTSWVAWDDD